jgi:hypothetical protein
VTCPQAAVWRGWVVRLNGGIMWIPAWMLPDDNTLEVSEGWSRRTYLPRHVKPPLLARLASSAIALAGLARERYLGTSGTKDCRGPTLTV